MLEGLDIPSRPGASLASWDGVKSAPNKIADNKEITIEKEEMQYLLTLHKKCKKMIMTY